MVIRYTDGVLKSLVATGKTSEPIFEHTLMSHAWALLRNYESDALYGLFTWAKVVTNRKFLWVKMAAGEYQKLRMKTERIFTHYFPYEFPEHAAGHLEAAATGYKSILSAASEETKLDPHIRDFIADQLTLCLALGKQWEDLLTFVRVEEMTPRATIPMLSITSKQLEHIIEYSQTNDLAVVDMGDWETLDASDTRGVSNDFSYHRLISLAENSVCSLSIRTRDKPYDRNLERMCFSVIHSCLQECLRTRSREHLNKLAIINHICHKVSHRNISDKLEHTKSICVDKSFGSVTLMELLSWTEYFDNETEFGEQLNLNLRMDVCSMTRKEGNLTLCQHQLETLLKKLNVAAHIGLASNEPHSLDEVCDRLIAVGEEVSGPIWNQNTIRGAIEMAKWMYCYSDKKEKAIQLAAANTMSICKRIDALDATKNDIPIVRQRVASSLLKLAEWVQPESEKLLATATIEPLGRLIKSLNEPEMRHNAHNYETTDINAIATPIDLAVPKLISYGIKQCPTLAKAWGAYGNWCYRWGRKIVELRADKDDKAGLSSNDVTAILELLPAVGAKDIDRIADLLNQHKVSAEDEDVIVSNTEEMSSTEIIESDLRTLDILADCESEVLQRIIEIWRLANRSIYRYYELAADAYFKYLQLATKMQENESVNVSITDDANSISDNCSIVTATLRILRLIVKHALGLQEVLEKGLETTPSSPWEVIIPQLFSRLNHHEPYVRKRVSELLCRVACDSPHLIIFPAVVGAGQEHRVDIGNLSLSAPSDCGNSALTICFNSLLDTLSQQASEPVKQVQLLVHELKRISLLWDELWLSTLTQVYSEYGKRVNAFESDLKRVGRNENQYEILNEKYRVLIRPILFAVERLYDATVVVQAETAHELTFQERYSAVIADMIEWLKRPLSSSQLTLDGWHKLKQLHSLLQQRSQKRSACLLKMADISPVLAQMSDSVISMPGIESHHDRRAAGARQSQHSIYVRSVDNVVHILPTKTKPKKLIFHGSDGRRYTYLFKGLEDLHLDERIMQFLSIANSMMAKSRTVTGQSAKYRAKHYSVIPLGPRSGLISWVDGMTPIFALYKKWQQRQATNPKKEKVATAGNSATTTSNTPPVILRPSEMFYRKLTPLLASHNLKTTDNRKEWPLSVLKEVLAELTAETPRDLLAKELWCYSTNAAEWRQVIRNYSQSIAVMSVIGYVIGLGDRHLDNVMVDLSTGEILHIDYNVCFEKVRNLLRIHNRRSTDFASENFG